MNVTVMISHWPRHVDRFHYFLNTIESLYKFLPQSTKLHHFNIVVGIESQMASPHLIDAATSYCVHRKMTVVFNETEPGLGKVMNAMLEHVHTPYVLYFQDDYGLAKPLSLDHDIEVLEGDNPYSLVRYSAHKINYRFKRDSTDMFFRLGFGFRQYRSCFI